MRDVRCKESLETIRSALVGNYQPEHVFAAKQALALYDLAVYRRMRHRNRTYSGWPEH